MFKYLVGIPLWHQTEIIHLLCLSRQTSKKTLYVILGNQFVHFIKLNYQIQVCLLKRKQTFALDILHWGTCFLIIYPRHVVLFTLWSELKNHCMYAYFFYLLLSTMTSMHASKQQRPVNYIHDCLAMIYTCTAMLVLFGA